MTLSLQVDEIGGIGPNAVYSSVANPEQFILGFSATLSSQAERIDKFNMFYRVKDLRKPVDPDNDICVAGSNKEGSSLFLESDLGIQKWINDALLIDRRLPSSSSAPTSAPSLSTPPSAKGQSGSQAGTAKPDTISYEVKFILISGGNLNPSWKLARVSVNTANTPLLSANRTRTHDLIITLGPSTGADGQKAQDLHLASQIGAATANSLRPFLVPQ